MSQERDLMDDLGKSFDLLKSAHHSIRASLRNRSPLYAESALRQWARGVAQYTDALEALLVNPQPAPGPLTPAEEIERVRSRVLGRIRSGQFVKEDG